jgi:MFS family permease
MSRRQAEETALPSEGTFVLTCVVYLLPALIDLVAGQFFLIYPNLLARQGQTDFVISLLISVWGVFYALFAWLAGRIVTPENASRILIRSCLALTVLCWAMSMSDHIAWVFVCTGLFGCCGAFFFPPFQVFMKKVQGARARPVIHSVGFYTFAWSMGIAIGPFIAGQLMKGNVDGWRLCYQMDAVISLLCLAGVLYIDRKTLGRAAVSAPEPVIVPGMTAQTVLPDLAWLGWIGTGAGLVALTFIRALFPAMAVKELHLGEDIQGTVFFLMCLMQGLAGLVLSYSGRFMYNPRAPLVFGALGVAGSLCFVYGTSPIIFYIGSLGFGTYAGFAFFYLVFHALVHPTKSSRYVAFNEAVVGLSGILGAPLAGALSDMTHNYRVPFGSAVGIIIVITIFQAVVHVKNPLTRIR